MMNKKYLMSGFAAVVVAMSFTSCKDKDLYDPDAVLRLQQYQAEFARQFGEIDENQSWGFEGNTRGTRGVNSDANNWNYDQFDNFPKVLTEAQKDKVRRYFQQHKNPTGTSVAFTDFFVQQVYKGATNLSGANADCLETYTDGNGNTVVGSDQMDYLMAGQTSTYTDWEGKEQAYYDHIENFNFANFSNGNANKMVWDLESYEAGYPLTAESGVTNWEQENKNHRLLHQDMITLMENSSTTSFGYHTSQANYDYHNKFVIIAGDEIQKWDTTGGANADVSGMWFVGFDYEGDTAENPYFDQNQGNKYIVDADGNVGGRDGYFSDWIVRITPGHKNEIPGTTTKTVKESGRIFCEDLGSIGDFDFNDVVFDAVIYTDGTCDITFLAAGGTLTAKVAGYDVHAQFEGIDMINTGVKDWKKTLKTVTVSGYEHLIDIPVVIEQTSEAGEVESFTLAAEVGKAPQKICVPVGTKWVDEYVNISTAYPDFKGYVNKAQNTNWYQNVVNRYVDLNLANN